MNDDASFSFNDLFCSSDDTELSIKINSEPDPDYYAVTSYYGIEDEFDVFDAVENFSAINSKYNRHDQTCNEQEIELVESTTGMIGNRILRNTDNINNELKELKSKLGINYRGIIVNIISSIEYWTKPNLLIFGYIAKLKKLRVINNSIPDDIVNTILMYFCIEYVEYEYGFKSNAMLIRFATNMYIKYDVAIKCLVEANWNEQSAMHNFTERNQFFRNDKHSAHDDCKHKTPLYQSIANYYGIQDNRT